MTAPPPRPGRRFDDEQVSLILRRAAELQEAQAAPGSDGMTLADLEEVAREAGLDPGLVRRAAAEVGDADTAASAAPALAGRNRFLGAPTVLRVERVVDGELPVSEFEALLDEIRRSFNDVGSFSTLGRTLAWQSTVSVHGRNSSGRQINVSVVVRGGRTEIRVEETTSGLAGALFGGVMGGVGGGGGSIVVGIGMGALHSPVAALGMWGMVLGASYIGARTLFVTLSRRRGAALTGVADRLAELAEGAVGPAGPRRLG